MYILSIENLTLERVHEPAPQNWEKIIRNEAEAEGLLRGTLPDELCQATDSELHKIKLHG